MGPAWAQQRERGPRSPAVGMPAPWGQVRQSWGWERQSRGRGALSRRQPRRAAGGPAGPLLRLFTDWLAPQEAPENPWPEKAIQISQAARGVGRPCRTKGGQPRRWGGWSARGRCTAGGHGVAEGPQAVAKPLKEEARRSGALTPPGPQPQFPPPAEQKPPPGVSAGQGASSCAERRVGAGPRSWPAVAVATTAVKGGGLSLERCRVSATVV